MLSGQLIRRPHLYCRGADQAPEPCMRACADQIVVPYNREVKILIFHEFHGACYADHLGFRKPVKNRQHYFTWLDIWAETETCVE